MRPERRVTWIDIADAADAGGSATPHFSQHLAADPTRQPGCFANEWGTLRERDDGADGAAGAAAADDHDDAPGGGRTTTVDALAAAHGLEHIDVLKIDAEVI